MSNPNLRYRSFSRSEWAEFRSPDDFVSLDSGRIAGIKSLNDRLTNADIEEVYLPLNRFIELHLEATKRLLESTSEFLHVPTKKVPFVLGIAGSVAAGKSTTARVVEELLGRSFHVSLVTTDGFLYPTAELEARGLMDRKGFPESYDVRMLVDFLSSIKSGAPRVTAPVYSHIKYDRLPGEEIVLDEPDILILEGINILPSTFTIALFPILSRYAAGAPDALLRAYVKSMKYLVIIAMPLMIFSFVYADFIILVFGGEKYLPESAIALRLIIGFLPLSFINNVTHYVLIAVNQQKFLTRAFVLGAAFNISANLLFIPTFSYRASAIITIFSELALLIPFYIGVRKHVGRVDWIDLLWRPIGATGVMALLIWLLDATLTACLGVWSFAIIIPAALLAYLVTLVATRTFNADDREMLGLLLPRRFQQTHGENGAPH